MFYRDVIFNSGKIRFDFTTTLIFVGGSWINDGSYPMDFSDPESIVKSLAALRTKYHFTEKLDDYIYVSNPYGDFIAREYEEGIELTWHKPESNKYRSNILPIPYSDIHTIVSICRTC